MECLEHLKKLLSYIPQNNREITPKVPYTPNEEIQGVTYGHYS